MRNPKRFTIPDPEPKPKPKPKPESKSGYQYRQSMAQFIMKQNFKFKAKEVGFNPTLQFMQKGLPCSAHGEADKHYLVSFTKESMGFETYFSLEEGDQEPVSVEIVLTCFAQDALAIEIYSPFHNWTQEFGFDLNDELDFSKANLIYRICLETTKSLRGFLGEEAYRELLWGTEYE